MWIIDKRVYAEVVDKSESPNSYLIKAENGNIIRWNRWQLIYAPYKKDEDLVESYSNPGLQDDDEGGSDSKYPEAGQTTPSSIEKEKTVSAEEQSRSPRQRRSVKPNTRYKDFVCDFKPKK